MVARIFALRSFRFSRSKDSTLSSQTVILRILTSKKRGQGRTTHKRRAVRVCKSNIEFGEPIQIRRIHIRIISTAHCLKVVLIDLDPHSNRITITHSRCHIDDILSMLCSSASISSSFDFRNRHFFSVNYVLDKMVSPKSPCIVVLSPNFQDPFR